MVVSSDSDYCLELHISLTNTRDNQGNLKKERKLEQRGLVLYSRQNKYFFYFLTLNFQGKVKKNCNFPLFVLEVAKIKYFFEHFLKECIFTIENPKKC